MGEVKFCVHVEEHEGVYGITLFADDGIAKDTVPCLRSCFRGEAGRDPDEITVLFAEAHQEAMDEVGLQGVVPESEWEGLLMRSVELAGAKLKTFGLEAVAFSDLPDETLYHLFAEALPDGENAPGSAALN
jgi:hypothetical protein